MNLSIQNSFYQAKQPKTSLFFWVTISQFLNSIKGKKITSIHFFKSVRFMTIPVLASIWKHTQKTLVPETGFPIYY